MAKLDAERQSGHIMADVIWTSEVPDFYQMKEEGLLEQYTPTDFNEVLNPFDDYDGSCSFKTWLKRKYGRPYLYSPRCEDMKTIEEELRHVKKRGCYDDIKYSLIECGGDELLERLAVGEAFMLSNEFFYEYDYGDGWRVRIELLEEYENKDSNPGIEDKLGELIGKVMATLAPICLDVDGLPVFDDVGGIGGFCDFLKGLHGEENDHGYAKEDLDWAKNLGWNGRMSKADKLL